MNGCPHVEGSTDAARLLLAASHATRRALRSPVLDGSAPAFPSPSQTSGEVPASSGRAGRSGSFVDRAAASVPTRVRQRLAAPAPEPGVAIVAQSFGCGCRVRGDKIDQNSTAADTADCLWPRGGVAYDLLGN